MALSMLKPVSRATATWGVLRSVWAVCRRLEAGGRTDGATVEEVLEEVLGYRDEPIDYRTVATQLRTLEAKGLLVSTKHGRRLYYRPVMDEVVAVGAEIRLFLDQVIHDDPQLLDELERQLLERRYDLESRERQRKARRSSSG